MLPKFRIFFLVATVGISLFLATGQSFAQSRPTATPAPSASPLIIFTTTAGTSPAPTLSPDYQTSAGTWTQDDREVSLIAKANIRAQDFLDWVLIHGQTPSSRFQPIKFVQQMVVKATYVFALLVIIGVGFLLMIRRNKDITLMKFLPLFLLLMAYVFLSYPIVKEVYALNERLMKSFMQIDNSQQTGCSSPQFISTCNLLHISFNYHDYDGSKRTGPLYDESAYNNLLLIQVTSWTYMTMGGILVLRQIVLWFFIIVAPMLALLIPFPLLRNTAKIWVGEFFRWLLYGTLFAIFLRGLIEMWRYGIPMGFQDLTTAQSITTYPTSIKVLLAGPNYLTDTTNPATTSLNNPDTYANYIVALIMMWVIMILPWLLLRVFRDALGNWMESESGDKMMGQLGNMYSRFSPLGQKATPQPAPAPVAPSPAGAGQALQLPFRQVNISAQDVSVTRGQSASTNQISDIRHTTETQITQAQTQDLVKLLGMQTPKLTDIAKMEMNNQSLEQGWSNLQKLGNPNLAQTPQEMQHIAMLRAEITRRAENGDASAQGLLQAAQSATAITALEGRVARSNQSQTMAAGARRANATIAAALASLNRQDAAKIVAKAQMAKANGRVIPVVNRTQSVSLNDYEEVKHMWVEHYRANTIPPGVTAKSKAEWIQQDITRAEQAVAMLGNMNPTIKQQGMEAVASLLPFLLLGGFSEQETITYLKAKIEAAKQVLGEMQAKEAGEKEAKKTAEESVEVENKKHAHAEEHLAAEIPDDATSPLAEAPQDNTVDAEAIENQLPSEPVDEPPQK